MAGGEERRFLELSPYARAVWMWREMVRRCNDFTSRPEVSSSGRVLSVRYEELVADPLGVGRTIVEFLDHQLNRAVRRRLGKAHTDSIGLHRGREPGEVALATEVGSPELERLGYV